MTQEIDKTNSKLKTITDIFRDSASKTVTKEITDKMETIETTHLRMAFRGGQSNTSTFEEWYNETFVNEIKQDNR